MNAYKILKNKNNKKIKININKVAKYQTLLNKFIVF